MRPALRARPVHRTRTALLVLAALLLSGCATRQRAAELPRAQVAPGIVWRIEEGDLIKTRVYGNPELNADASVNASGTAFFPSIGRVSVAGLTIDSVETLLNARYSSQVIRNAAVQVSMQREVTLYGQVRSPGIYASDPSTTIIGLIARAGGQVNVSSTPTLTLQTAGGQRLQLPGEARLGTIDLHRLDAIHVSEESFLVRNAAAIAATSAIINILAATVGLLTYASR